MSDKQQTAVQYLEDIALKGYISPEDFERAKELFKQQIIEAIMPKNLFYQIDHQEAMNEAEQYFNETFKTESNGAT